MTGNLTKTSKCDNSVDDDDNYAHNDDDAYSDDDDDDNDENIAGKVSKTIR